MEQLFLREFVKCISTIWKLRTWCGCRRSVAETEHLGAAVTSDEGVKMASSVTGEAQPVGGTWKP